MSRIAIIGAGAWGTALSIVLGRKGSHDVRLWAREPEIVSSIQSTRENPLFLPGHSVPETVSATANLQQALHGAEIVVSVVPSQYCRALFTSMRPSLSSEMLFVSATKGLEEKSLMRMTAVIADVLHSENGFSPRLSVLSGPSFAREVARGDPAAVTIASQDSELAETVQREFSDPGLRLYTNDDVVGVELAGALKNVIAIAAGICHGLGLGHNSIAALITRGLAEITRLAVACGGRHETLAGLAGLGDLVLTCTGGLSRNRSVGVELGRGRKLPEIVAGMHGAIAEGVFTTNAGLRLATSLGVEMPITEQVYAILNHGKPPRDAIHDLMTRSAKSETQSAAL